MPEETNVKVEEPKVAPEPDLISRVVKFKKEEKPQEPAKDNPNDINFDFKELESIKDPAAKEIAMKAYKSMQAGATKKYQEIAQMKKEVEEKLKSIEPKPWTPERIDQELLKNPEFLKSAQILSSQKNPQGSGLTDEEFSALTEKEKTELISMRNELNNLKHDNFAALVSQKDIQLQSKYSDYEPSKINTAFQDLSKLTPIDLREYIYKSVLHDEHVKAAYEMGKTDALKLNNERKTGMSFESSNTNNSSEIPKKDPNESSTNYFIRLAQNRLSQIKKG